jgi:NhaP-type Na+/H+ or K+/H+ antiporter
VTLVVTYAVLLLLGVLVAERASRSVLSVAVLFLAGGFLVGPGGAGLVALSPEEPGLGRLVELTLFAVLFADGMRLRPRDLRPAWRLAGRALLLGMPLVFAGTAWLAHVVAGLDWPLAWLVGAVLAPTDPVLAAALVGREEVPARLRGLLNVESGLNDGLALPVVLVLLASAGAPAGADGLPELLGEVGIGIAVGVALPWLVLRGRQRLGVGSIPVYEPLLAFSIALLVWCVGHLLHANPFLAAYAAGVSVAVTDEKASEDFEAFGEVVTELLKLASLLLLGVLFAPASWSDLDASTWAFAALALVAVRPLALPLVLLGSELGRRERIAAAWFGPKGFASVAYALLIVRSGVPGSAHVYHVLAVVIALSIVVHSSSDVLVARWFHEREEARPPPDAERARSGARR